MGNAVKFLAPVLPAVLRLLLVRQLQVSLSHAYILRVALGHPSRACIAAGLSG